MGQREEKKNGDKTKKKMEREKKVIAKVEKKIQTIDS